MLEGEPFKELLAQPSLRTSQPAEVGQVVTHLLDEFHLLIQEAALQEVSEVRVCAGRTQGMQVQKGLVQVLLRENGGFHSVLGFTPLILRWLLHVLEEGVVAALVLYFQETFSALALLLGQFTEKVAHTLKSPIVAVEIEALREVGIEGLQMQVDQAVDRDLHLGGIILTNLGAQG